MNTIGPCGILKFGRGALWLTAKSLSLSPFGKPPVSATKILWGQIAIAVLNVLATTWAATQWTAWRLGFQPQLGQPWFEIVPGMPVYLPPAFFWWWYAYDAYAPRIFLEGAGIAASGGFIFMAGYGLKSFLIAQSLNQIEKAYGPNNSILDNCHVRVCFATNDERTAKRVSDALGISTELRAMKNYAGHRLSPWLGHLMVSRQETARPLLTAGEVMQLPPNDELVLMSGTPPIRAKKVRYFEDPRLSVRVLPPPQRDGVAARQHERGQPNLDDWTALPIPGRAPQDDA